MRVDKKYIYLILLIGIIFISLIIRIYMLSQTHDRFYFMFDPANNFEKADSILHGKGIVVEYVWNFFFPHQDLVHPDDFHEPFYSIFLAGIFFIFGESLIAAKLFSLAIGIITIILVFFIFSNIFKDKRIGLLSSFFLSLNPAHSLYSVIIMKDGLFALLLLVSVYFAIKALNENRSLDYIFSGIFCGMASLTRYEGLVCLSLPLTLLFLWKAKNKLKNLTAFLIPLMVVLLPWAIYTYRYFGEPFYTAKKYVRFHFSDSQLWSDNIPTTLRQYFKDPYIVFKEKVKYIKNVLMQAPIFFNPVFFILFILGVLRARNRYVKIVLGLIIITASAFLISAGSNAYSSGGLTDRYYLGLYLLCLPIIANEFLKRFSFHNNKNSISTIILTSFMIFYLPSFNQYKGVLNPTYWKDRYKRIEEVGKWFKDNTPNDTKVMFERYIAEFHYFSQRKTVSFPENFNPELNVDLIKKYKINYLVLYGFQDNFIDNFLENNILAKYETDISLQRIFKIEILKEGHTREIINEIYFSENAKINNGEISPEAFDKKAEVVYKIYNNSKSISRIIIQPGLVVVYPPNKINLYISKDGKTFALIRTIQDKPIGYSEPIDLGTLDNNEQIFIKIELIVNKEVSKAVWDARLYSLKVYIQE